MDTAEVMQKLEKVFPLLANSGYRISSARDRRYNCIAYAAGDNRRWWQPGRDDAYWPNGISDDGSIESLIAAFAGLGYERCTMANCEDGYEKVALYGNAKGWQHAAIQGVDGKWKSKLGKNVDIEHDKLDDIECNDYGKVVVIMRRRRQ